MDQKILIQKLCQLPCFKNLRADDISIIAAGLSQPCFCVAYNNNKYFAKYLDSKSVEATVAQLAATQGISPDLIYVGHNWLITEFIVGEGLNTASVSESKKIAIMLALISRCHTIDYKQSNTQHFGLEKSVGLNLPNDDQITTTQPIPTLDILTTIKPLLTNLECDETLKHSLDSLLAVLKHNLSKITNIVLNSEKVLCHGDANFANAMRIKSEHKSSTALYQLIDFECACIAPREYDIAMLLAVNEIERNKIKTFNLFGLQHKSSANNCENLSEIVDNILGVGQFEANISSDAVTCYYDLSILVNYLWYFTKYQANKQQSYKILAENQMSLLSVCYSQANTILDQMR